MKKRAYIAIILCFCILAITGCVVGVSTSAAFTVGDNCFFGNYHGYPIEWRVIGTDAGTVTFISSAILDEQKFDSGSQAWNSSSLKTWLNNTFYNAAFNSRERSALAGSSGSKVALLTESGFDALPTGLGSSGPTVYAAGLSADHQDYYWLADEGDGTSPANARYVDASGTKVTAGIVKTLVMGVRPVIKLNISAIKMMMNYGIDASSNEHNMPMLLPPTSPPYVFALSDPSLPTLTVTGWDMDDSGLTVSIKTSEPLGSGQKVFCYLKDSSGKEYIGWSNISGGKVFYNQIAKATEFTDAYLVVGVKNGADQTCYMGSKKTFHPDPFRIDGISEGQNFEPGDAISFSTHGSGLDAVTPVNGTPRTVPYKWDLTGGKTGTWSLTDPPSFTANLADLTVGSYTLNVYFKYEKYDTGSDAWVDDTSKTDAVRTVKFTVSAATPSASADSSSPPVAFTVSATNNRIYTNGRITITPSVKGGVWQYPHDILTMNDNGDGSVTFRGLKAGDAAVTYTVGWTSGTVSIQVLEAGVPSTGQDFMPVVWLLVCAAGVTLLAVLPKKLHKRS